MKYPNLFIVGAAKSGTTTLWQYLRSHRDVFVPQDELYKEPAYFSINKGRMYLEDYLAIFDGADDNCKWVCDASTSYLTDPESANKIYDFNPEAKIIILLRNPAERAYSLYNWMVQEGYEYAPTFEDALKLEALRATKKIPNYFEPEYYYSYMYFSSGLYFEQVKSYLQLFGSNLLIIKFDDLKNDFDRKTTEICSFLKIDKNVIPPKNTREICNISRSVYSSKIQFILRKINNILLSINTRILLNKIDTKKKMDGFLKIGIRNQRPNKMLNKTRNELIAKYKENINDLSRLTEVDFTEWVK